MRRGRHVRRSNDQRGLRHGELFAGLGISIPGWIDGCQLHQFDRRGL
jgi:hypothetical protein